MSICSENIQLADIDNELTRLRDIQKEKNQINANLFTLIIYAHNDDRIGDLRHIVQSIIEKFPCRVLMIEVGSDPAHDYVRVKVSNAVTTTGDITVACDQITIEVGVKQLQRVPFIILPHILPDLPVHLLWGEDPTMESEILPKLEKFATRLIYNSDCMRQLKPFSEKMLKEISTLPIEFMDMNWALIAGWRDVLNQVFDLPEHLQGLRNAQALHIFYNAQESQFTKHPEIQAVYLQAWLAACLGWKSVTQSYSKELLALVYNHSDRNITVQLHPKQNNKLPTGSILSVEISSIDGAQYLLTRDETNPKVIAHFSTLDTCEVPFTLPLPDPKRGFTFMKEIFYRPVSSHYKKMLEVLAVSDFKLH
jgi:glucose-6-phosphate dehydrogenase assembly protein OpcA